jgi:hypothetical protein
MLEDRIFVYEGQIRSLSRVMRHPRKRSVPSQKTAERRLELKACLPPKDGDSPAILHELLGIELRYHRPGGEHRYFAGYDTRFPTAGEAATVKPSSRRPSSTLHRRQALDWASLDVVRHRAYRR